MNIDLESELAARLLSRILKVETLLALTAAVILAASVVPSRKAYVSAAQADWSDSGAEYAKPSPFPVTNTMRTTVSRHSTVSPVPAVLPVMQPVRNNLPESVPSPDSE